MASAIRRRRAAPARPRRQRGYTYLLLLFAVAALGLISAAAAENWSLAAQRERERELLFIGNEYREALRRYVEASPDGAERLPASLDELVNDTRFPAPRHHLRRLYADPLSGDTDWGLLRQRGRISGVFSRVDQTPVKHDGFLPRDHDFVGARSYRDWKFQPAALAAMPTAAGPPPASWPTP